MSMRINQNVLSQFTYANLTQSNDRLENSIGKLSSGLRINNAADDAAGLAISEKMRRQIRGLQRANLNAQDGISMIQTAEGGLGETQSIIQRMRELALQSANDTLTSNDRLEIQKEVEQLKDQVDTIAQSTEFNTKKLLNGNQSALISTSSQYIEGFVTDTVGAGGDYNIRLQTIEGGVAQMQNSQIFRHKDTGALCTGGTKLEDITAFYAESGEFALESPQTLTISGNGRNTTVKIDRLMTLNEVAATIQNAIASQSGLGMDNTRAQVMTTDTTGENYNGGYIKITSGFIGDRGDFAIAGAQDIMDAFGFTTTRDSKNSIVQAVVKDQYGNTRTVNTSTDKATGLLDGIDVKFDSQSAQVAGHGGIVEGLYLSGAASFNLTVPVGGANVTQNINIAAGNWSLTGIAAQVQATIDGNATLKDKGLTAAIVDNELRITYSPSGADADKTAITITGGNDVAKSVVGIKDGSYNGFVAGTKDKTKSIEGISTYSNKVTTATTINLKIKDATAAASVTALTYVVSNAITGPDLLEVTETVASANAALRNGSVAVRLDEVNGTLVFTSTDLGYREDGIKASVNVVASAAGTVNAALFQLGFAGDTTAYGAGDTSFRVHVVNTQAQFQIGADAGDNMKIGIADMSTEALGLDTIDLTSVPGAEKALEKLNQALDKVSSERAKLGAYQNRLNYTRSNISNTTTNLSAAESRIRDVDVATEMMEFTRDQIVTQAATSMLAQANALPQNALSLLG